MAFLRVSSLDVGGRSTLTRWLPGGKRPALHDIELMLEEGSMCTVFGAPGSGKSILLQALAGLRRPRRGQIVLDGVDVTRLRARDRRAALVPATPVVYERLTVEENLAFPLQRQGLHADRIKGQVTETASLLGLLDCLNRPAGGLPASTAQRVALGRALVRDDLALLLLDNALHVLDEEARRRVVGALRQVQRSRRLCIVLSTSGRADVMGMGDEWLMLAEGRILQQGRPAEFVQYPRTLAVARWLGGRQLNVVPCRSDQGVSRFAGLPLQMPVPPQLDLWLSELQGQFPTGRIELAVRAEHVGLGRPGQEGCMEVVVQRIEDHGTWMKIHAVLPETEVGITAQVPVDDPHAYDLAVMSGGGVAGRRLSLQLINRHSLFYVDGRLIQ
ncbi:MAG: ATP-binding cassette domain-containing protein [Lautropia sp.]|nr:ATP-binding cassette domain-containing protein [Lautropia sp.]